MDADFRGPVHQQQCSEDHARSVPPIPELRAMRIFASRTNSATDRISNATPAQLIGRIESDESPQQQLGSRPATPGTIRPGEEKLHINSQRADHHQDESDVGVGDGAPSVAHAGLVSPSTTLAPATCNTCLRPSQRVISRPSSSTKSCCSIAGDQFDELLIQQFLFGERLGFAHRGLGQAGCCGRAAKSCYAAEPRHRSPPSASSPHPSRRSTSTGEAAPALVPGAIAATSPASSRKKPAEAARPPLGVT